jgi:hypothetical protein
MREETRGEQRRVRRGGLLLRLGAAASLHGQTQKGRIGGQLTIA